MFVPEKNKTFMRLKRVFMKKTSIDLENYNRKDHFNYFKGSYYPYVD